MKAKDLIPGAVYNANRSSYGGIRAVVFVRMGEARVRKSFTRGNVKSPAKAVVRHVWIDSDFGEPSGVEGVTLGREEEVSLSVLGGPISDSLETRRDNVRKWAAQAQAQVDKVEREALAERRQRAFQWLGTLLPTEAKYECQQDGRVVLDADAVEWICGRLENR